MRIQVDTDYLQEMSCRISEFANVLPSLQKRLSAAWGQLNISEWEEVHRDQIEQEWWRAQTCLNSLVDQAKTLSLFLVERADRFEEADHAGVAAVGRAVALFAKTQQEWNRWFQPNRSILSFPQALAGRLLRLGGWDKQIPFVFVVTPSDLGNQLVGTCHLRSTPPQWCESLEEALET